MSVKTDLERLERRAGVTADPVAMKVYVGISPDDWPNAGDDDRTPEEKGYRVVLAEDELVEIATREAW